jgi:hypothetical protein
MAERVILGVRPVRHFVSASIGLASPPHRITRLISLSVSVIARAPMAWSQSTTGPRQHADSRIEVNGLRACGSGNHPLTVTNPATLRIYLNDHLAGSIGGIELAKRSLSNNRGTRLGQFLSKLLADIEADRISLEQIMDRFGVSKDPVKQTVGWLAEKVGRLKFNGQLLGYSGLSRLVELEGLALGVEGKLSMWRSLLAISSTESRLDPEELRILERRARSQRTGLERQRLRAAAIALG